ncbi:hypothetical protein BGZ63DRAFT_410105 [Mariannaea sp. PMI_226]|nr:hypothetical protein BGZ63DRAFT_410105 [Mariannaea sp. PMI_226]
MATNLEVVHAYRHLFRSISKAVQYAYWPRRTAIKQLRIAFREPGAVFDGEGIKRTVWFLECAARERGIEHKILKNLIKVRQWRDSPDKGFKKLLHEGQVDDPLAFEKKTKYWHYDMTVAMLNKTMGLCLR